MPDRTTLDISGLYAALDVERHRRDLLWRDVAAEARVSQSTLTRLKQGKRPDVDSFAALVDWAGLPADHFVVRTRPVASRPALSSLVHLIRRDPHLSPSAARCVEAVTLAAYGALRELAP